MSLAFQKLNGAGTVATAQLDVLKGILEELKRPKSDLYLTARLFEPVAPLAPITKTWLLDFNSGPNDRIQFDGRYFGKWTINYMSLRVAIGNGDVRRSVGRLWDDQDVVAQTGTTIHGNDQAQWNADHAEHFGYATSMSLNAIASDDPWHSLQVQLIGFKVPEPTTIIPPVLHDIFFSYPVGNGSIAFTAGDKQSNQFTTGVSPGDGLPALMAYASPSVFFKNLGEVQNYLRIATPNMVKDIAPLSEVVLDSFFLQDANYNLVIQKLPLTQNFTFINKESLDIPIQLVVDGINTDYKLLGNTNTGLGFTYPHTFSIVNKGIYELLITVDGVLHSVNVGSQYPLPDYFGVTKTFSFNYLPQP
ncbi:hypothetical protein H7F33_07150 [Pedobacter sp. PAMC26386]|nr:hypothetical protein H7F33_07150 [Pedobacter sp. PAMC26386]